jgi:hypothetical protein
MQERFWDQMEAFRPATYVADGHHLIVVSQIPGVLEAVAAAAQPGVER